LHFPEIDLEQLNHFHDNSSGDEIVYAPPTGRWLSEDPAGYVDSPHRYLYVKNNPAISTDPSGLQAKGRTCKEVCTIVLSTSGKEIDKSGVGGVFCDDNRMCFCVLGFSQSGYTYTPGKCSSIDKLVLSHEKEHEKTSECNDCNGIQRAPRKAGIESERFECKLRRRDLKRLTELMDDKKEWGMIPTDCQKGLLILRAAIELDLEACKDYPKDDDYLD
jgi:hypothetical protein